MRISVTLAIVLILTIASCSQNSSHNGSVSKSGSIGDNSIPVHVCASFTYGLQDAEGSMYNDFISAVHEKAVSNAGDHGFTEGELARLGVWEDRGLEYGGNLEHSLRTLAGRMHEFYSSQGRLPVDSQDVISVLGNSEAVIGDLYNPITCSWYQSFTSEEWDVNAVNIEITDNPAEAKRILLELYPELEDDGVSDTNPNQALHMVVYGEEPGSVIFDDWFF